MLNNTSRGTDLLSGGSRHLAPLRLYLNKNHQHQLNYLSFHSMVQEFSSWIGVNENMYEYLLIILFISPLFLIFSLFLCNALCTVIIRHLMGVSLNFKHPRRRGENDTINLGRLGFYCGILILQSRAVETRRQLPLDLLLT